MQLYGKHYLTTVEDSAFVQLNVQWFKADCIHEGYNPPSVFMTNPVNRETLIYVDKEGEYNSLVFETRAPSQTDGNKLYYRKVVTIRRNVKTLEYLVHDDPSTFVKFTDSEGKIFKVAQVLNTGSGDLVLINANGIYMILDLGKLDSCTSNVFSVYPFNTIFPVQGSQGSTYIKWKGRSQYINIAEASRMFGGFKSGTAGRSFKWSITPSANAVYASAYEPLSAKLDLITAPASSYESVPSLFDTPSQGRPITAINGRNAVNGNFDIVYNINTEEQEEQDPTYIDPIDLSEKFVEIPEGVSGIKESYLELPLNLGGVNTEEVVRKQYKFTKEDRESEAWCYNIYDMTKNEDTGYFDVEDSSGPSCDGNCRPNFNGKSLDTLDNIHTRISLLNAAKNMANGRDWLDLNEPFGITMTTDPTFSLFSINKAGYQDSAAGGLGLKGSAGGFFSLVKVESDEFCICDYASLEKNKKDSGPSVARIIRFNHIQDFQVPYTIYEIDKRKGYGIFLRATAVSMDDAKQWTVDYVFVEYTDDGKLIDTPFDTLTQMHIFLGRVERFPKKMEIYQAYDGGIAVFDFDNKYNYYGEFTIVDTSTYTEGKLTKATVTICNGIDATRKDKSKCKVNNVALEVPPTTLTWSGSKVKRVVIVVTIPKAKLEDGVATVELMDKLPSDSAEKVHYLVGSVYINDNRVIVSQDHKTGVPQMYWYLPCDFELDMEDKE